MQRVPSCLLLAGLALSLGAMSAAPALARPGLRGGGYGHAFVRTAHVGPRSLHRGIGRSGRIGHRGSFGYPGYGRRFAGRGLYPGGLWGWPDFDDRPDPYVALDQGGDPAAPSYPAFTGIPSLADLPADTGIGPSPVARPAIYVINGSARRRSGGKAVTTDGYSDEGTGPRIIQLNVPRR
jgi:hypothetical protein